MSLFIDHLLESLRRDPPGGAPEEVLFVDTAGLRVLLLQELRRQPAHQVQEGLVGFVRDGLFDEYLQRVADVLIGMGICRRQEDLDRFLHGAALSQIGARGPLSDTEVLLLELALRTPKEGCDEPESRVLARRYARRLHLLRGVGPARTCTALGQGVRDLPPDLVLPFLVFLESITSTGADDAFRAPREAYLSLYRRGEASAEPGPGADARLRRWVRMGLCEAQGADPSTAAFRVVLTGTGRRALFLALRTPPSEVVRLCEALHQRAQEEAVEQIRNPRASLTPDRPDHRFDRLEHKERRHSDDAGVADHASPPLASLQPIAKLDDVLGAGAVVGALPYGSSRGFLDQGAFDVEVLCQGVLRDLRANPRYQQLSVTLSVPAEARPVMMLGERRALRRLLSELLAAAATALQGQSSPRLLLELGLTETEVLIGIHDNGPGIPVSQRGRIFEDSPLRMQGDPGPRYRLGALQRIVADALQGRMEIAAPRLGGASFRLLLPRQRQRQAA